MTDAEQLLRREFCDTGKILFDRGLAAGAAGNMSVALDDGYIVTPTGSSMGALNPDTLSRLNLKGELIAGQKQTKEALFHIALYEHNPEIKAVIHLHSTYSTAYACLDGLEAQNCLKPMTPYLVMRLGKVILTPYRKPGSPLIAEDIAAVAPGNKAFLLANHGMVVGGKNLSDALNNAQELEESCRLFFVTQGYKVRYLTAFEVAELA